jgi:ParB-like chromosome segregation protein Spo0J
MKIRITRTADVDPSTLTAHPSNWRDHPIEQSKALTTVLDRLGWIKRVIVNETTNRIIDGHLRVEEAIKAGATVPVVYVKLNEREEALVLAVLDPLAAEAGTDQEQLRSLIDSLRYSGEIDDALDELLREVERQGGILGTQQQENSVKLTENITCPRCGSHFMS